MNPLALQLAKGRPFAPTSWGAFGPHWLWVSVEEGGQTVTVNPATERETANPITPAKPISVLLGVATEAELAQTITPLKPIFVPVETAIERELARIMTPQVGEPFLPTVTCDVIGLGLVCEAHALGVESAILGLGVECEVT